MRIIYNELLDVILRIYEITEEEIKISKKLECVDARATLVHLLSYNGFSDNQISRLTQLTQQSINYLKNNFDERLKRFSVRYNLQVISKEITSNLQDFSVC